MTELDGTLSELARLKSGSEPIVSLYLDVRWSDEQQRDRVRLFVQERTRQVLSQYPPGSPGREGLARTLSRIQGFVSTLTGQAVEPDRGGLALFACESPSLWRPLFFDRPLGARLETGHVPHLIPLARLADDVAPAIVVLPQQDGADVFRVRYGEVELQASPRGLVPREEPDTRRSTSGVPSRRLEREAKNERHEQAFVQKARRAAANGVTALFDQHPGSRLILVGLSQNVAAFERELPDRVQKAIAARLPKPRAWESGDGALRDGVRAVAGEVLTRERVDERRAVDTVVGEALRGGLGVLGPEDVVLALNEGRVHTLVLEDDFRRAGYRCDHCGALGSNAESADDCPFCGGELRVVHDLGEALVARTLADGGRVAVVTHANRLHSYRGVAAFLRQSAPTGLRGASPPWPAAPGADQP